MKELTLESAEDIAADFKNPNSLRYKALLGYVTQEEQKKAIEQWVTIFNLFEAFLHKINGRASVAVASPSSDNVKSKTSAQAKDPASSRIEPIVFPEKIQQLQQEIKALDDVSQKLHTELKEGETEQREEFNTNMATLVEMKTLPDALKAKLAFTEMDSKKQKEFSEIYRERAASVDVVLRMSQSSLREGSLKESDREMLEKSVAPKAELLMIARLLKHDDEKILPPSEVKLLSQAVLKGYLEKQRVHHNLAQKIKIVEQTMATKMKELAVEAEDFVKHHTIHSSPPSHGFKL